MVVQAHCDYNRYSIDPTCSNLYIQCAMKEFFSSTWLSDDQQLFAINIDDLDQVNYRDEDHQCEADTIQWVLTQMSTSLNGCHET